MSTGIPKIDLKSSTITRGERTRRVSGMQARFANILRAEWPRPVKVERIIPQLWPRQLQRPADPRMSLRSAATELRKVLRPMGWDVEHIKGVQGITLGGYRLRRLVLPVDVGATA